MIDERLEKEVSTMLERINEVHGPVILLTSDALDDNDFRVCQRGDRRILRYLVEHLREYADVYLENTPILGSLEEDGIEYFEDDDDEDEKEFY